MTEYHQGMLVGFFLTVAGNILGAILYCWWNK